MVIGKGEAAALPLTKVYGGIIASNNLKGISRFVEKYKFAHVTTGDIVVSAMNVGLINESTGNQIWSMSIKLSATPISSAWGRKDGRSNVRYAHTLSMARSIVGCSSSGRMRHFRGNKGKPCVVCSGDNITVGLPQPIVTSRRPGHF